MQDTYWDFFFHCPKQSLNSLILGLLVLLSFFASLLPHGQNVSLWELFSSRETKASCLGCDWVNRESHAVLDQKLLEHSLWCGQVHLSITHHEMGKCVERLFKKNSLKPKTASHNNASWYMDTDGFLEHSPSRGHLYQKGSPFRKIILVFIGSPTVCLLEISET